jgi:hypothetical protein
MDNALSVQIVKPSQKLFGKIFNNAFLKGPILLEHALNRPTGHVLCKNLNLLVISVARVKILHYIRVLQVFE